MITRIVVALVLALTLLVSARSPSAAEGLKTPAGTEYTQLLSPSKRSLSTMGPTQAGFCMIKCGGTEASRICADDKCECFCTGAGNLTPVCQCKP
jgi:hypothetical protein